MFDTVHRKKDIFDKRPEDHPQYPEEWRIFWEKRYQEIQSQGKNPDQYDYKPDWIPYWAKKVEELYQSEIKTKTKDLMNKFNLKTDKEPIRVNQDEKKARLEINEQRYKEIGRRGQQNRGNKKKQLFNYSSHYKIQKTIELMNITNSDI